MTIKLQQSNLVILPLSYKNETGNYILVFKFLQSKKDWEFAVTDATPTNRFAAFEFETNVEEKPFLEGTYTYTLYDGETVAKRGIAYYGLENGDITEYESDNKITYYEG